MASRKAASRKRSPNAGPPGKGISSPVDQLFPDLRRGEFVERYFPNRPLVAHGPLSRLPGLANDKRLQDPASVLKAAYQESVIVFLSLGEGRRHQAVVDKETALELL